MFCNVVLPKMQRAVFGQILTGIFNLYNVKYCFEPSAAVSGERSCYVCSGKACMENPYNPSLSPGRIPCHPVDHYCVTHIRYLVRNESLGRYTSVDGV